MSVKRITPVISKEAEDWENTPSGTLANLRASIDLGTIEPKEMIVVYFDRKKGRKNLVVKAVGTQQKERYIGMLEMAKHAMLGGEK